jgi:hypothetical protein
MRVAVVLIALATAAAVPATAPTSPGPPGPEPATPAAHGAGGRAVELVACPGPRGPLVAYGHSYLHSPGIGGARASYATLAAASLGVRPVIRAVDKGTTLDVERLVRGGPTRWVPGTADLVVIDSGINDIGRRVPTARWTAALRRTLSTFAARPVPVILLVRPLPVARVGHPGRDPRVVAAYAAAQRAVASEFSAVRVVDASAGWSPRVHLSLDGVHPNAAGMLHLARAVQGGAQRSFCKP